MSRVQLRNSGPSYSLVMPLTNIVLSWRTAACLAMRNQKSFLDLVQCSMLADNIYELVPVEYETMYKLDIGSEKDMRVDVRNAMMQSLVLLVRAHVVGSSNKVKLGIHARQPYVGWTYFTRIVSNLKRSCKNKERPELDVIDLPVAKSQVSKFKGTTRNSADFQNQLNCLLRIPRDLSVITTDGQTMSMYDKMLKVDGNSIGRVMSKTAFINMLESIIIDDDVLDEIAAELGGKLEDLDGSIFEQLYGAYLRFVLNPEVSEIKQKNLTDRLYAILTPSRTIKKQLKQALGSLSQAERDKQEAALAEEWRSLARDEVSEKNQRTNPTGVYSEYLKAVEDLETSKETLLVKQFEIDAFQDQDDPYDLAAAQKELDDIKELIQQQETIVASLKKKPTEWRKSLEERRAQLQAKSDRLKENLNALVSNVESLYETERTALEASLVADVLPYIAEQHERTAKDKKKLSPLAGMFGLSVDRLTLKLFAASGWRREMYDKIRTSFFGDNSLLRSVKDVDENDIFSQIITRLDKCIEVAYTYRTEAELELALKTIERAYNTFEKEVRARIESSDLNNARTAWNDVQKEQFPALSKDAGDDEPMDFKIARLQQNIIDSISRNPNYTNKKNRLAQIATERDRARNIYDDFIKIRQLKTNKNINNADRKTRERLKNWEALRNTLGLAKNVNEVGVEKAISNIREDDRKKIEDDADFKRQRSGIQDVLKLRQRVLGVYKNYQALLDPQQQQNWQNILNLFPECKEKSLDIESTYKGLLPMCEKASDEDVAVDKSGDMSRLIVKLRSTNPAQVTSRLRRRNDIMSLTSDNMSNIKQSMTTRHVFDIGLELAALPTMSKSDMARYFEHEIGKFGDGQDIPGFDDEGSMVPPTPVDQFESSLVVSSSTPAQEPNQFDRRSVVPSTPVDQSEEIARTPSQELQEEGKADEEEEEVSELLDEGIADEEEVSELLDEGKADEEEEKEVSKTTSSELQEEETEGEPSYIRLPIEPERPAPDVLQFFGKPRDVENDTDWNTLEPQAQLAFVLPIVECLWDWMPIRADLILGTYVWVLCKKISSKKAEYTNVIWSKIDDTKCHTELNLHRLIAEANGDGARVLSAFGYSSKKDTMVKGSKHEYAGFQTYLSDPPTKVERTELRVFPKEFSLESANLSLRTALVAVASLEYQSQILYFDFEVSGSQKRERQCAYGSDNELEEVWSRRSTRNRCAESRTAWLNYQQLLDLPSQCSLSDADTDQILKISFPVATKEQEGRILSYVDTLRDCRKPEVMLNHKNTEGTTRGFKFLACGTYGCSSFWQSTSRKTESVANKVTKQMVTHTNAYYKREPNSNNKIWSKETRWLLTLQREYDMLKILHEVGVAVQPLSEPVLTGQSLAMLLITKKCGYYPPVGMQYWTFSMEAAKQTVFDFIICGNIARDDAKRVALQTGIYSIFKKLREARLTHGDFHLGNIMYLNDMNTLKLIDTGYSSDVFDPYYDLIAFTVSCADIQSDLMRINRQDSAAQVKKIQDYVYDNVKSDMRQFDGIQDYPMVTTVADRNKYFHGTYENAIIRKQLNIDGMKWYNALKLPKKAQLTPGQISNIIDDGAKKSGVITRMTEFQQRVLRQVRIASFG